MNREHTAWNARIDPERCCGLVYASCVSGHFTRQQAGLSAKSVTRRQALAHERFPKCESILVKLACVRGAGSRAVEVPVAQFDLSRFLAKGDGFRYRSYCECASAPSNVELAGG